MASTRAPSRPVLLIVSDRPLVWTGFKSPVRDVRRWIGERESDEERSSPTNFTGDPTDSETYRWTESASELSAVVDLQDAGRAAGAVAALRRTRPEAGVLIITADGGLATPDIAGSRRLAWTDALRVDLEGELLQLEAVRRLNELRKFADGDGDVAILVHPDPDPDALASALALRALLQRSADSTPIVTLGAMTRPENRRMASLLRIRVTEITAAELHMLERVIAVDCQPHLGQIGDRPRLAIIDHHPRIEEADADFTDVQPGVGATATLMTQYLRLDDEYRFAQPLATALLYGIKSDTDSLARGCVAADVDAYAFLQNRADLALLRTLERPSYALATARSYGCALANLASQDDIAAVFLGRLADNDAHVLADVADFCIGLDQVTWAVAGALIDSEIVLAIRRLGATPGAGDLAESLTHANGSGGGHPAMARARFAPEGVWAELGETADAAAAERLLELVKEGIGRLRASLRSSRPAHQATTPSAAHE